MGAGESEAAPALGQAFASWALKGKNVKREEQGTLVNPHPFAIVLRLERRASRHCAFKNFTISHLATQDVCKFREGRLTPAQPTPSAAINTVY